MKLTAYQALSLCSCVSATLTHLPGVIWYVDLVILIFGQIGLCKLPTGQGFR